MRIRRTDNAELKRVSEFRVFIIRCQTPQKQASDIAAARCVPVFFREVFAPCRLRVIGEIELEITIILIGGADFREAFAIALVLMDFDQALILGTKEELGVGLRLDIEAYPVAHIRVVRDGDHVTVILWQTLCFELFPECRRARITNIVDGLLGDVFIPENDVAVGMAV